MGLDDVIRGLRTRVQLIAILVLVGLALAAGLAALWTAKYTAEARIQITGPSVEGDQVTALQKLPTLMELLQEEDYLSQVDTRLELDGDWEDLRGKVGITNPGQATTIIQIAITDTSAARAAVIANDMAENFDDYLDTINQQNVRSDLLTAADEPGSPSSPKFFLWLAVGGVLGLTIGVSYALAREAADRSVRDNVDLYREFGLTRLGAIPYERGASKRPLAITDPAANARAEAIRQLRTNLQFLHLDEEDEPPRSILFTSAVGGEGKTSTACNVAIALARAGLSTVLVGADLRRPDLAALMSASNEVGVTSVLVGWSNLAGALQEWGTDEGLAVLTAGPPLPNPSELLASEQMQQMLRTLEERADIVIVDGAPLLPVADSAALAAICSGTVLCVGAGIADTDQVARAQAVLEGLDARVYGGVLTMVRDSNQRRDGKGYLPPPGAGGRASR